MRHGTRWRIEQFAENTQKAKKGLGLTSNIMVRRLAALLYALEGKQVSTEAILKSHEIMKSSAGIFSAFRGNMSICIAAMLSLKADPKGVFDCTVAVYEMMKDVKFRRSDFLAVAAFMIAVNARPENYYQTVVRMRHFYDGMKAQHWFYTGIDDYIFAAMFALSDIEVRSGVETVERLYQSLTSESMMKESVHALAQIMAIGGISDRAAIDKVVALRDASKAQGIPLGKPFTLPSLGILAMLPIDVNTIVQDLKDAEAHLKAQKGFGTLSVSKQELMLYAVAVTASGYVEDIDSGLIKASISTSVINIIIAAQTVMIASMAASSSAAAGAAAR